MMSAWAKGSTLHTTLAFLGELVGERETARVLIEAGGDQPLNAGRIAPTDEFDFARLDALWQAADRTLAKSHPTWIEESGAYAIGTAGAQLYGGILRKASPTDFLTQSVSLFRLYYRPGDMEVVAEEPGAAILRLVGFDTGTPLFCRRQTGGLGRAIALAGGEKPQVSHVRCRHDGDAFCEWGLRW